LIANIHGLRFFSSFGFRIGKFAALVVGIKFFKKSHTMKGTMFSPNVIKSECTFLRQYFKTGDKVNSNQFWY
jgi:hypothetical protein